MENIIKQLNLDKKAQLADFRRRWNVTQVRVVRLGRKDIGWLQSFAQDDTLFLAQLFVEKTLRGRGIGTRLLRGLIEEAATAGGALTLGVVKTNPALRLYQRFGFRITREDERKFYMRREQSEAGPG